MPFSKLNYNGQNQNLWWPQSGDIDTQIIRLKKIQWQLFWESINKIVRYLHSFIFLLKDYCCNLIEFLDSLNKTTSFNVTQCSYIEKLKYCQKVHLIHTFVADLNYIFQKWYKEVTWTFVSFILSAKDNQSSLLTVIKIVFKIFNLLSAWHTYKHTNINKQAFSHKHSYIHTHLV